MNGFGFKEPQFGTVPAALILLSVDRQRQLTRQHSIADSLRGMWGSVE